MPSYLVWIRKLRRHAAFVELSLSEAQDALAAELRNDSTPERLSVFRADRPDDDSLKLLAALWSASYASRAQAFHCVVFDADDVQTAVPVDIRHEPDQSPFGFLNSRHYEICGLSGAGFRACAGAMMPTQARLRNWKRPEVCGVVIDERSTPTVTTHLEWRSAKEWATTAT